MLDADPKYPNLTILNLNEEADAKRLPFFFSGVSNHPEDVPIGKERRRLATPAESILNLISPQNPGSIGAKGVIAEFDYIDRDTNIDYAKLYARAFRDYPRRTLRLHFFGANIASFDELGDQDAINKLQASYLGFSVISPVGLRTIGRTVLPPPKTDKLWFFVPTQCEFHSNVGGIPLRTVGTAFAQQDGRIAACASAATWMSTVLLSRHFKYDVSVRSMAEITELATQHSLPLYGRGSLPGINVGQILWALQSMGYEPFSYDIHDHTSAIETIYSCIESGIPPIVIIYLPQERGYHAVTVVGHSYDSHRDFSKPSFYEGNSVSVWSPHFLIHDDQQGPYLKASVAPPDPDIKDHRAINRPRLIINEDDCLNNTLKEKLIKWYSGAAIHSIIAPFPPRHVLRPEQAAARAKAIFTGVYLRYGKTLGISLPENSFYRTYFIKSNDYKRRMIGESNISGGGVPGLSSELAHWYRGSAYPKYIWVTELCSVENRRSQYPEDLRIIGDVTLDPTSPKSSRYSLPDFITLHIPHAFFRMPPNSLDPVSTIQLPVYIKDDQPFQPLVRMEFCQSPYNP